MDIGIILSTLAAIFLAEVGDKTQLAVLAGTAASKRPVEIFIGASLGLVLATAVGVLVGRWLGDAFPERFMRLAGGALFIVLGAVLVFQGWRA